MIMNTNCKGKIMTARDEIMKAEEGVPPGLSVHFYGLPLLLGYWHHNQFIRFEYIVFTSLIDEWTNELAEGDERKRQERNASASKSSSTGIK